MSLIRPKSVGPANVEWKPQKFLSQNKVFLLLLFIWDFSIPPQNLINTDYKYKDGKTGFDVSESVNLWKNAILKSNTRPS